MLLGFLAPILSVPRLSLLACLLLRFAAWLAFPKAFPGWCLDSKRDCSCTSGLLLQMKPLLVSPRCPNCLLSEGN